LSLQADTASRSSLTREQRSRHLYATGSTGSGKSKFLEYLIRQDILNWRKSGV
jgi:hypothetical protein